MAEKLVDQNVMFTKPNIDHLITEDDEPVDNMPLEKQQRLLVEPLYSSWQSEQPFIAAANVGIFGSPNQPAIVPDMFLSLKVQVADNWWAKEHRSYFVWEFGKAPEAVIEIVSNTKGGETDRKLGSYAQLGIEYYAIFDPQLQVQHTPLQLFELQETEYVLKLDTMLDKIDLGLMLWEGIFEGKQDTWLRWCDSTGAVIPTGNEKAQWEHDRAEVEYERAERLAAKLRELGIDPDR